MGLHYLKMGLLLAPFMTTLKRYTRQGTATPRLRSNIVFVAVTIYTRQGTATYCHPQIDDKK